VAVDAASTQSANPEPSPLNARHNSHGARPVHIIITNARHIKVGSESSSFFVFFVLTLEPRVE